MKTRYDIGDILVLSVDNRKMYYYVYDITKKSRRKRIKVVPLKTNNNQPLKWDGDTTYSETLYWSKQDKTWQVCGLDVSLMTVSKK